MKIVNLCTYCMILKINILSLFVVVTTAVCAQSDTVPILNPDRNTVLFHDFVDKEQSLALKSDGKEDDFFSASTNEEINFLITRSLIQGVDQFQYRIEKDTVMGIQTKIRYLRGVERLLKDLNANWKSNRFAINEFSTMLLEYSNCVEEDRKGMTIENIIDRLSHDVAQPIVNSTAFDNNIGFKTSKNLLVKKYCHLFPDKILLTLSRFPDVPFADSLIKIAAYNSPMQLYDYAAANDKLGVIIRKIEEPLISAVVKMANSSGNGQLYFPFLDNVVNGTLSISDIDLVRNDSLNYYRLLVKTHIGYAERLLNKDTARGYTDLIKMLEIKARDIFVNTINALHNEEDAIRFKIIQPLSAEELYYLAVLSDGIIYTSSFVKGVFPLMMRKVNNRGDSLLMLVKFDRYRKFLKMTAGYNTLNIFLNSFSNSNDANDLMRAFVGNLEKSNGLEDGVDVADSYASIVEINSSLSRKMFENIKWNYERNLAQNNKKGFVIYKLLHQLFQSADTTKQIDLTLALGIDPVYNVPFNNLVNDSGVVVIQVFFYGDKDGQAIFQGFQKMFNPDFWKITNEKNWIAINSTKGKKISIFANRALSEETGEDELAQKSLDSFLITKNLNPTVAIHRGHSYYAPYTITQLNPVSKIVFMGSCGGYHLIHSILKKAPDAHIIASKQIGKTAINRPFFELLLEKLRNGKDIQWISFWKEFQQKVKVEGVEDYIPPHKNLGAIFLKAYSIAFEKNEAITY